MITMSEMHKACDVWWQGVEEHAENLIRSLREELERGRSEIHTLAKGGKAQPDQTNFCGCSSGAASTWVTGLYRLHSCLSALGSLAALFKLLYHVFLLDCLTRAAWLSMAEAAPGGLLTITLAVKEGPYSDGGFTLTQTEVIRTPP
jgi:hypothetical protein